MLAWLKELVKQYMEKFKDADKEAEIKESVETKGYKWMIKRVAAMEKMVLTEDAWQWIEAEDNEDILKMLFFVLFLTRLLGDNKYIVDAVRAIFENRKLAYKIGSDA